MEDFTKAIASIIDNRTYNSDGNVDPSIPFRALDITFFDVVYSIVLIEKSLDIDLISEIDKSNLLNYTVNDFISLVSKKQDNPPKIG